MKIGLIQTRGIGDIVIAAPIAQYYIALGCEVFWPVDQSFHSFVQAAFPAVRFIPIENAQQDEDYFFNNPLMELNKAGCERIFSLYSYLTDPAIASRIVNRKLAASLKFDEYKYAISDVPFDRKWNLSIVRDSEREAALFDKLDIRGDYILLHEAGSDFKVEIKLDPEVVDRYQIVRIRQITGNPFDWIGVIDRASLFACVDSCFANLAEQLNLRPRKLLYLRSDVRFTPVFRNAWKFV